MWLDFLLLFIGYALAIFCIAFQLYLLYAIIISKNCKYPPAVPSFGNMKKIAIREAEKILSANKNMKIVDLGCGTGGLLLPLAKKFTNHSFTGIDWDNIALSICRSRSKKIKNISLVKENFLNSDLSEYDLILCFLDTKAIDELNKVLKNKIKNEAIILSLAFEMKDLELLEEWNAKSYGMPLKVYKYKLK